jgi:carbamate kinase
VDIIKTLIEAGVTVIAGGGGGIPVFDNGGGDIEGSEAVIDKDRASSLLSRELGVDLFIISTDADQVYVDFKKKTQRGIPNATADEMQQFADEGQFPAGSMGPKVESAIRFVRNGGKKVIITSYEYLVDALDGKAGTHIVP